MKRWCLAILVAGTAAAAPESGIGSARELYQAGRLTEAESAFQQLAAANPHQAEAVYYLGKIAVRQGDYTRATRLLKRAVVLAPGESDHLLWLGNALAWAAATAPLTDKAALGRQCLAAYHEALELNPGNVPAHVALMNFHRHVPAVLGGGLVRARAEAATIDRLDATQGALALATLDAQEKNYRQALARLRGVLRENPANYAANCALGRLALATGEQLDEGAAAFRRCLGLCPSENDEGHEFVQWGLGQISELRHEDPAARRAYETSLRLNPRFQPAAEALAKLAAVEKTGS